VGSLTARRLLLLGTAGLFVARLVLSLVRTGPVVVADEVGYLTNARVLAGGVSGQMQGAPFYRGGYPLLIAPLVAAFHDPETAYRTVLVLNAVLAAALAPLLFLLLTRHFGVPRRAAVWPALAAAAYPSVTVFSQVALSENLLLPGVVVWMLCWGEVLAAQTARRRLTWSATLGACTIALFAVHGRMIVAVAVTAAAVVFLALRRRLEIRPAFVSLAVIAGGYVPVVLLNRFLASRSWGGHQPDEVGHRLAGLGSIDGLGSFARNLVGQSWYVIVATLGIGLAFLIGGCFREILGMRRRDAPVSAVLLGLALAMFAGLLVLSALSFRDVERPDMLVYGRYVEVIVPPMLAVALSRLSDAGRLPRIGPIVAAILAATVVVVALRATIDPVRAANGWNIASLPFLIRNLGTGPLVGAGVVASAAFAAIVLVARRAPAALAPLVLVLFLPTTAAAEHNPVLSGEDAFYSDGWTSPGDAAPQARVVAYDLDHRQGLYVDQWFMPDARFVLFSGSAGPPPSRYVISSPAWARAHPALRADELWHDPGTRHVLFRVAPAG
jgi:hypothetical protein